MVLVLPLAVVEPVQQLVLALPLAAVKPNTTTGPCTTTCSHGSNYLWSLHCHLQPWSQVHNRSLHCHLQPWSQLPLVLALPLAAVEPGIHTTGSCIANAAVEPDITKETTLLA